MSKREAALGAGALWLAGFGLVVAVALARPRPVAARQDPAPLQGESQLLPAEDDVVEASELELPTDVLVGSVSGVAEMQGKDELMIGPGTVTYP